MSISLLPLLLPLLQKRAHDNPKIEFLWNSVVDSAYANEKGTLGGVKVKNVKTGEISDVPLAGLFFAIGHEPATPFLDGQVRRRRRRRRRRGGFSLLLWTGPPRPCIALSP